MKKTLAIILLFVEFFIIYFLQANFFSWFTIAGIKPNLFVLLVLLISLFAGRKLGIILGIIFGLFLDIVTTKSMGITAMMFGLIAFFAGYFDKNFSKENKLTIMLISAGATAICEIGIYIYNIIKLGMYVDILGFAKILIIEIIYNLILIIILYPLIQKMGEKLEEVYKNNSILTKYF